ncbi:MAG: serine/threonine protein phosphatase [Phycisphaerales bacterium]|nr:serine/threonine protein phosphatase [Phycisphaerales bacterium]
MRWIIGDIHGMLAPLEMLLRAIDVADDEAELLFIGDYVNRGSESSQVVETLLSLPDARFIRGNHDDIFDLVINRQCFCLHPSAPNPIMAMRWFLEYGLDKTLISYGADPALIDVFVRQPSDQLINQLTAGVPQHHRNFFRQLPGAIDEGDFFMVHACWPVDEKSEFPGINARLKNQSHLRYTALWERFTDQDITRRKSWRRTGFFGHTPTTNYTSATRSNAQSPLPLSGPQIMLIDTGCVLSPAGRLTAYCVDTDTFIQATPQGRLVEED